MSKENMAARLAGQDIQIEQIERNAEEINRTAAEFREDHLSGEFVKGIEATFTESRQASDRAYAEYTTEVQNLYRSDGVQVYSNEQHDEMMQKITAKRDGAFERINEQLASATQEIERRTEIATQPPTLDDREMNRASSRREFVREDIDHAPLSDVLDTLRRAEISEDRAEVWVTARYALMRADRELSEMRERAAVGKDSTDDVENSRLSNQIKEKAAELRDSLGLPGAKKRREELQRLEGESLLLNSYIRERSITDRERKELSTGIFW